MDESPPSLARAFILDESPPSLVRACSLLARSSRAEIRDQSLSNLYDPLLSEPGPASTMVGNIIMGTRIGGASGREVADIEEDSDMARKVSERHLAILKISLHKA